MAKYGIGVQNLSPISGIQLLRAGTLPEAIALAQKESSASQFMVAMVFDPATLEVFSTWLGGSESEVCEGDSVSKEAINGYRT